MAFSYDNTLYTALDRVRHTIGDTDENAPLRDDDTIEAMLIAAGTTLDETVINATAEDTVAAQLAESLAMEFARKPDSFSESGGISISWRERVKAWLELSKRLRAGLAGAIAVGSSTGSWSVAAIRDDTEVVSEYLRPAAAGLNWFTE